MPTKAELEAEIADLRTGDGSGDVGRRLAALERQAAPPPAARASRPDAVRARYYSGALLNTALQSHPDEKNYPGGKKVLSATEEEVLRLRAEVAGMRSQKALRDRLEQEGDAKPNEEPERVPGPPDPPAGQAQYG